MKRMLLWPVLLAVLLAGCAVLKPWHHVIYNIGLEEVERPAQAEERYGEQKITQTQEGDIEKFYFEDDMVGIIWSPTSSQISFILTNKTDHSIRIIWDEAAYVDVPGESHRVMHSGVKYIDRNNPQPPSVIVRKGSLSDFVVPTDRVVYVSGRYGGWKTLPLFPNKSQHPSILEENALFYKDKTVQLLLPLQIEDVINDYIFTFKVNDVRIEAPSETTQAK